MLHDTELYPPNSPFTPIAYLTTLREADKALQEAGARNYKSIVEGIRLLTSLLARSEQDAIQLKSQLQAVQYRLEQATETNS